MYEHCAWRNIQWAGAEMVIIKDRFSLKGNLKPSLCTVVLLKKKKKKKGREKKKNAQQKYFFSLNPSSPGVPMLVHSLSMRSS